MKQKLIIVLIILLLAVGCTPLQKRAIQKVPEGNSLIVDCSLEKAMEITKDVLFQMGFATHAENAEKVLKARKAVSSGKNNILN
jgi:uncharacterized protein YcfL